MRLYVAGPMTGIPNYNFPAFAEATARLRAQYHDVISPAEHDVEEGWVIVEHDECGGILRAYDREVGTFDWHKALDWDLKAIDRCDGIYLLPGWTRSRGATKEYEHAERTGKLILGAVQERAERLVRHQPLVGLVGYAQAGKDTFAGFLSYARLAFADPLKQLALACKPGGFYPPGSYADDYGCDLTDIVAEYGWEYTKAKVSGVREFLQDLGVGAREILDPDIWVKAAFAKYDPTQPTVITDVRFPNEIEAIRHRGGVIVRVEREGHGPANGHVSEFAWQATEPDHVVRAAEGALGDLKLQADWLDRTLRGQG